MNAIHATNAAGGTDATRRTVLAAAVVIVGLAGLAAWADVRVFVTSSADGYGLDLLGPQGDGTGTDPAHENWPIDPFRPTYSTVWGTFDWDYGYDYEYGYYRAAAYPPIDAPSGTPDDPILIDVSAGEIGYMWFQFRGEPRDAQVNGFICSVRLPGGAPAQNLSLTYYVQNNRDGEGRAKRFDGPAFPPDYENWHANPFITDQVYADSIRNESDNPEMMHDRQATSGNYWTGVALLGAMTGNPSEMLYQFRIDYIDYSSQGGPEVGESCFFRVVPEPGGAFMILAGACALLRRRQPRAQPSWDRNGR